MRHDWADLEKRPVRDVWHGWVSGSDISFIGTCFALSNKGNIRAALKLGAAIGAALVLCGFAQLIFGDKNLAGGSVLEYYRASASTGMGGGLVGGLLAGGLSAVVGTVGAFIVLLAALIICIVCITEKSVVKAVKNSGDKAYQYAREDMDRRREIRAERQEERRRLREEQRVRGVDLDATKIEDEAPQIGRASCRERVS